jgi:ribonuclease H2 subunit B
LDKNLTVYRFSLLKTLQLLQNKVARLSTPEFATASRSIGRSLAKDGLGPDEKVSEGVREGLYFSSFESVITHPHTEGRTKLACQLVSQYLPQSISEALLASYRYALCLVLSRRFSNCQPPSFTTLEDHLKSLEPDAFLPTASSTADGKGDTGKKGSAAAGANGNPKKRKAESQASNGVKKLQRTDTTRMNKLTSFFAKGKPNEKAADKGEEPDGKEDR